jgi:hypothetical protein
MLAKLIQWLLGKILGSVVEGVTKELADQREDRNNQDLGAATERAQNAEIGKSVSEAMAQAETSAAKPDAAESALEQGNFLLSPAQPARKRSAKALNKPKNGRRK